ncbi:MAG: nitroreductase family protein [Candidatus Sericytochromatia bacterium]|nr:nitroreductase family protein [Candidatus Sericytochromatia bacterium]
MSTDWLERLRWRYATKKMDPTQTVSEASLSRIIEAIRLAPTSSGLQPFELLVVTNPALREQIRQVAWGQAQVTEGSHLLVFAAWDTYTAERINMMFDLVNQVRGSTNEGWERYRAKLLAEYPARDAETNFQHAALQAYIGLGFALAAAALEGVDGTPMEGFEPDAVDRILGLRERGLRSVVLLPLGHRDEANDWLAKLPKVRRPVERFVTRVE